MLNKSDRTLFGVTCSVILAACVVSVSGGYPKIAFTDVSGPELSPKIPCRIFKMPLMSMKAIIGKW